MSWSLHQGTMDVWHYIIILLFTDNSTETPLVTSDNDKQQSKSRIDYRVADIPPWHISLVYSIQVIISRHTSGLWLACDYTVAYLWPMTCMWLYPDIYLWSLLWKWLYCGICLWLTCDYAQAYVSGLWFAGNYALAYVYSLQVIIPKYMFWSMICR